MDVVDLSRSCSGSASGVSPDWTIDAPEEEALGFKNGNCIEVSGRWPPITIAFCIGIIPAVFVFGMVKRNELDPAEANETWSINPDPRK